MKSRRLFWFILAGIVVVMALVFGLLPRLEEAQSPTPQAVWIAIETERGSARVGRIALSSRESFRLHAVMEAVTPEGNRVFYAEVPQVEIAGELHATRKPAEWRGAEELRLLWFSVEAGRSYLEAAPGQALGELAFQEFFRPEWGRGWSVAGSLRTQSDEQLAREPLAGQRDFGTLYFQVWLELFEDRNALVPKARLKSAGADRLAAEPESYPGVAVSLAELGTASTVFGLPQVEVPAGSSTEEKARMRRWFEGGLAFSRLLVLEALLGEAGVGFGDLTWQRTELNGSRRWGSELSAGDLLRVGARWVILYRDGGQRGVLDGEDLCFDFERGAVVRTLGAVFVGEGDVELARLRGTADR